MPMKIIGFGLLEFCEVHFKDPPAYTVYFAWTPENLSMVENQASMKPYIA